MKITLTIFIIVLAVCLAFAEDGRIEISEEGWQKVALSQDQDIADQPLLTDEVPFNDSPDWFCPLRMQVGGVKLADLDGDGDLDLAVGCYSSQSYPPYEDWRNFILYNIDGELESSPSWWSDDQSSTTEICIADFDNDGHNDIFAANGGTSFDPSKIYYYNETTDSVSRVAGWSSSDNCYSTGAAACDFDIDGDFDVATSNQGMSPNPYRPVHIFVNNDGDLEQTPSWSSSAEEISGFVDWGDYDDDGFPDLAVSKWVNFYSCVYHNFEGAIETSPAWTADNNDTQKGIGWGDLTNDSYPELAIGASSMPTQLYANDHGTLSNSPVWQSDNSFYGCQDLRWGDIDNDGDPDLATVHFSNGHLRVYLNVDGVLETAPSWLYDSHEVGTALEFGDINGDGFIDLVMGVSGDSCLAVFYNTGMSSVDDNHRLPAETSLLNNYPNPFNAQTTISFTLNNNSHVRLNIYDITGRLTRALIDQDCNSGYNAVIWDGKDSNGEIAATGVYYYRLIIDNGIETEKMVLLK